MTASKFWIQNRLKEPSTWRAIVVVLGIVGLNLTEEEVAAAVTVGGLVYATILAVKKDAKSPDA